MSETFQGEITVAARIIDYLSSGLYQSPAACLKELVNNAYDADATVVEMFVKPRADRIIISDNGNGMSREEFEEHFRRIAESHKRDETEVTDLGRSKIGFIGIGFIAANEICDVLEIISTKRGSNELLEVTIDFKALRQDIETRRGEGTTVKKADYEGTVSSTDRDAHYTKVFLKSVKGEARDILALAGPTKYSSGKVSLYGLKSETVAAKLRAHGLDTWSDLDTYSKTRLEIGLTVPVEYAENWMPERLIDDVVEFSDRLERLNFTFLIDGTGIRKPIVFNPEGKALVRRFEFEGEHVSARGYFYAQHTSIKPMELQGLLIRIRDASVGSYDPGFMGFSPSIGPLFQQWISAEIYADDRLEAAMNIDRRTLRVAHPAYAELQEAVHEELADFINKDVRKKIYGSQTEKRRETRAKKVEKALEETVTEVIGNHAPDVGQKVISKWRGASSDPKGQRRLTRKLAVDEIYRVVSDAAAGILSEEQLEKFLSRLTELLQE